MSSAAPQEGTPLESGGTPAAAPARGGFFALLMWLGLAVAIGIGLTAGFLFLRQETAARARIQARAEAAGLLVNFSSHSECPTWLRPRGPVAVQQWLGKHWLPFWERVDRVELHQLRSGSDTADNVLGNDLEAFRNLERVDMAGVRITSKGLVSLAPRVRQLSLLSCDLESQEVSPLDEPSVLERLSIEACRVHGDVMDPLLKLDSLHEVDFRLNQESARRALAALANSPHLTTLTITRSDLRRMDALNIPKPFPVLESLRLEATVFDESSLSPFAGAPALGTIELERMYSRNSGPKLVVARMPALQTLRAHRAAVSGVELVDTPQLAFVELNHVRLAEDAFQQCATWQSVETLKVPHSGINKEMLAQIAQMPRLQHLDVRHFRDELFRRRRNFTASDLEPLAQLKTLGSLELDRTLTRAERSTVHRALPRVGLLGDTID